MKIYDNLFFPIKLIYDLIPTHRKPFKYISIFSPILFIILGLLITAYVYDEPFPSWTATIKVILSTILVVIICIVILFVFYGLKLIRQQFDILSTMNGVTTTNQQESSITKKKRLSPRLPIDILEVEDFECTVYVDRKWYPNNIPPTVDDFLAALTLSELHCKSCKSETLEMIDSEGYYDIYCPNNNCEFNLKHSNEYIVTVKEGAFAILKGKIRRNYDDYWYNGYIREYLLLTQNEPDKYDAPIN